MAQLDDHSFRKLLPGFVISAGTQVVLKVAKPLPGGQDTKPPGSVGVVLESPADNHGPYVVRFADGETVTAYFHDLALRRREVEDELGEVTEDLRPWITRHHYHHYRGFYATQRKLIAKEEPKRAKPVLYAYRVLMTGIHLLRSGEVEAKLLRLNEHFGFGFLDELIARKASGENTSIGDLDWPFHEARLSELETRLDQAFAESPLPEDRDRKPVNELLVRLRLNGRLTEPGAI